MKNQYKFLTQKENLERLNSAVEKLESLKKEKDFDKKKKYQEIQDQISSLSTNEYRQI
jgi:phosphoenolpyruvate carboxylase